MSLPYPRTYLHIAAIAATLTVPTVAAAATVPDGFTDTPVVTGLSNPTAMQFAPDGRLFFCMQNGQLRVISNGTLISTPFVKLTVYKGGERGLLGVAFDPDFATNKYVYVYYTAMTPTLHNRVSRFTASGNFAVPGSEVVILELDDLSTARNHNGGAIHFGNDGKLYVAVGDNANGANAESLDTLLGKILRINADGSIPTDNPFYGTATGVNRAIWARGLRNPFTVAIQPPTGRIFINDVGQETWEEINEGIAGADYGWPGDEGPSADPINTDPTYYYDHSDGSCAITGGAFYNPSVVQFPAEYVGGYFYGDYCGGYIRKLDIPTNTVTDLATGIVAPVDLKVGPNGDLYYLARGASADEGMVGRISYTGSTLPAISAQPANLTVTVGQNATFNVGASGPAPLTYQWRRDGVEITGATAASFTLPSAQLSDSGSFFDVVVSNDSGSVTSQSVQLTVTENTRPTAVINTPVAGTTFAGGDVISYSGTGNDVEDGALPLYAFTWWVNLHHDTHTHPQVMPLTGVRSGSFTIPTNGETSDNIFYRIHLRVADSGGLTREVTRDIQPRKTTVTLSTNPAGLQLRLDGQPVTTPHSFVGVIGILRNIEAVSPQTVGANTLQYASWSDAGAQVHIVSTPATNTIYTANYSVVPVVSIAVANVSTVEGNSGSKNLVFIASLSAASTAPVSVNWTTASGSAKDGTDFTGDTGVVNFPAGATSRTIPILLHGDTAVEKNENFYVDLSTPSGATLANARAVGTIQDDDGLGTLDFGSASYSKGESLGSATITVKRTGGVGGGMTVRYATSNGTATAGADYTATTGTLSFDAGVTSLTFQVPIANDTVDESNETVNVVLSNPAGGAVLGTRPSTVLTIVDNDTGGTLNFSVSAYEKTEDGVSASIKVVRSGGSASGVSVNYSTSAGTANPVSDFTQTSGTLVFAAGQGSASFVVPLTDNAVIETDETVNLTLSNPTGGAILGTRAAAVLTIVDDD